MYPARVSCARPRPTKTRGYTLKRWEVDTTRNKQETDEVLKKKDTRKLDDPKERKLDTRGFLIFMRHFPVAFTRKDQRQGLTSIYRV